MHRYRHKNRRKSKQGKIIMGSMIGLLTLFTVGYSAFQTTLNVNVKGNVIKTDDACFTVSDNGDGTGTITDYDKTCGTKVKVPSKINNLTITKIGDTSGDGDATKVFANKQITKVVLPDTLTYIGNYAFYADSLTEITIPDGVTYIGNHSFYSNKLYGELKLPKSLTYIGNVAFKDNQITKVDIPSSVTTLGGGTFTNNNMSSDNALIYGRNAYGIDYTTIDSWGGHDATDLELPKTITNIGDCAFFGVKVKSFTVPARVTRIGHYAFCGSQIEKIVLNEGLEYIGNRAFTNAHLLSSINIPSTVTKIESAAFVNCSALTTININKASGSITGSPWGATNATIKWTGTN